MNKDRLSSTERRAYDNSLRQEQARQTRRRILDSAVEALAKAGPAGVTLAEVAHRAGVSEPTLYRHFGSRERLYEALEAHANAKIGLPPTPPVPEELPAFVRELFGVFGANAKLLTALTAAGLGREMRARGRARRTQEAKALLAAHAPYLDASEADRVVAVMRVLGSWESFEALTGAMGLSVRDAADAAAWAMEVLLSDVRARARVGGGGGASADGAGPGGPRAGERESGAEA